MPGATINYSGTGAAVEMSPTTNIGNIWSVWGQYDFGIIKGSGGTPAALLYINLSINGVDQVHSSTFGNNTVHAIYWGGGVASYNILYGTPAGAFNAGGENYFYFDDNQYAALAEIQIGTAGGNSNDAALGTNHYIGNIAHNVSTASTYGIISDSSWDVFDLSAINCYQSVGSQYNVYWGVSATVNTIRAPQVLTCGGGRVNDNSTAKSNRVFLANSQTPLPTTIAGLPACGVTTEGWLYTISNGVASPAYRDAVSTTGATPNLTYCDASGRTYH